MGDETDRVATSAVMASSSALASFLLRHALSLGIAGGAVLALTHCGEQASSSSPQTDRAAEGIGRGHGGTGPGGGSTDGRSDSAPSLPPLSPYCEQACQEAGGDDTKWAVCYSCKCKQALGALPPQSGATCAAGKDIHVYTVSLVNGVPVERDEPDDVETCENPALLESLPIEAACVPGGKLGQGTLDNGVVFKSVCRRKPGVSRAEAPVYIDHGIIAHNPQNGATCYWVAGIAESDGVLPDVDLTDGDEGKIAAYTAFWEAGSARAEGDDCVGCHDNDPFVYSPHLKSVFDFDTSAYRFSPYAQVRVDGRPTTVGSKHLVSPEAAPCTSCHRISDQGTCSDWLGISTGTPTPDRPYELDMIAHPDAYFPYSTWMPQPLPPAATTHAKWLASFGRARDFIADCCANPTHTGCQWEDLVGFSALLPDDLRDNAIQQRSVRARP